MSIPTHPAKSRPPLPDDASHVLLVDDDQRIRELLAGYLHNHGFRVSSAGDTASARSAMRGLSFDVLILDVMLPDGSGIDLARELRRESKVPILMLTALAEKEDRVAGLEAGVDDYIPKPFEPRELLLRLNNILRRYDPKESTRDEVRMGPIVFQISRGELKRGDVSIKLTERERELLRQFAVRPGVAIARHELIATSTGADGDVTASERAVDVQINRLRRKIETDPANPVYLQTSRGRGYVLYTD
jgi:two-component system, OmpR family, phosphate regulon response regulator OmpR